MSSILDQGAHTVLVYPQVQITDSYGNQGWAPADYAVPVHGCTVTPIRGDTAGPDLIGARVGQRYRLVARDAPIGPWSRVVFEGETFSVEQQPLRHTASPSINHVSAILRAER